MEISMNDHYQTTGIVTLVEKFLSREEREALGDNPVPRQLDEFGRPLVDVECQRRGQHFGKPATEIYTVRVPETPEVLALGPGPVTFTDLTLNVWVKDGHLAERWSATGIVTNRVDEDQTDEGSMDEDQTDEGQMDDSSDSFVMEDVPLFELSADGTVVSPVDESQVDDSLDPFAMDVTPRFGLDGDLS